MPRITDALKTLRLADISLVSLRTANIRQSLSAVMRLNFDFVRSPVSRRKLETLRERKIRSLRSALVEATHLSHESGDSMNVQDSDLMSSYRNVPTTLAIEVTRIFLRRVQANRNVLSPSMVRTYLWHLGRVAARHGISLRQTLDYYGDPDSVRVDFDGRLTSIRIPCVSSAALTATAADDREKAYEAEIPRVEYDAVYTVSDDLWPQHMAHPMNCERCSTHDAILMRPEDSISRVGIYGTRHTVCPNCALISPCTVCGGRSTGQQYHLYALPEGTPTPSVVRTSELVRTNTVVCQSCAVSSNGVRRITINGMHQFVPESLASRMVIPTIQSYSFQPNYNIHAAPNERVTESTLCFGMELECGFKVTPRDAEFYVERLAATDIYFKRDGSVQNGIEVITHPFTYRYWKEIGYAMWQKRLDAMKKLGIRSYNYPNCGMHIHMSKAAFTVAQTKRLLDLVYGTPELFAKLSQRDVFEYCRLADPDRATSELRLKRAVGSVGSARPRLLRRVPTIHSVMQNTSRTSERRTAVNFPDTKPTIEMRLFRGTLHAPSVAKNVELCHALHAFTAQSRSDDVSLGRDFLTFIYDSEKEYTNLAAFLDRWYRKHRPVVRAVPPQYAVVRPPTPFEHDPAVASAS